MSEPARTKWPTIRRNRSGFDSTWTRTRDSARPILPGDLRLICPRQLRFGSAVLQLNYFREQICGDAQAIPYFGKPCVGQHCWSMR